MRRIAFCFALLTLPTVAVSAVAADPNAAALDVETLKAANAPLDGPGLVAYLQKQTSAAPSSELVQHWVEQLGAEEFAIRERATAALIGLGSFAEPLLRQALDKVKGSGYPDAEVLWRGELCLRRLADRALKEEVLAAAVRRISLTKPAGAAQALLDFAPTAPSESVTEAIQTALQGLAGTSANPEPALAAALKDRLPQRRALAGVALAPLATGPAGEGVRALLRDSDPTVCLRVGMALALAGEKRAVPVLIDLIENTRINLAYQVEQFLCRLADEKAPAATLGSDPASRKRCREAWSQWWATHEPTLEIAKLLSEQPQRGYTLLVMLDRKRVFELDEQNKVRWEISNIALPLDAQYLPGGRVLLAEQEGNRITERNLKGEILWQYPVHSPLMAQRLPGGSTLVATRERLLEVDREGKETVIYSPPLGDGIMRALKLPNGHIALVTASYQFKRIDPAGMREVQSFGVRVRTSGGRIDVLPNYHVLVPEKDDHRVVEYDARGTVVWQVAVQEPIAAVRLANGNTLVTSMGDLKAVEFDRQGKSVWEYQAGKDPQDRITRAFRR